jgi:UDP-glucose 4-epimerase
MDNLVAHKGNSRLFFVEADIADGLFVPLAPVLEASGPIHAIVHLAAQTSVQRSICCPLSDARINHLGTLQVLEFARLHGIRKVVFISSAAVYGDAAPVPTTESAPGMPTSPYGVHKLSGEDIMKYYARVHEISGVGLRLFNVYGSRQNPRSPYSGVISVFCRQSIANNPMTIYGDGLQTRDFVHVSDVLEAIVAAIRCEARGYGVFNIGTGTSCAIRDVAKIIRSACRSRSEISWAPGRAGDIRHSCADISAAGDALGFQPRVSIETGLADTVAWFVG